MLAMAKRKALQGKKLSLLLSCVAVLWLPGKAQQCGEQAGGAVCEGGLCCSKYGWCGNTAAYCAADCQSQCWEPPPRHVPPPPPPRPTPGSSLKRLAYFTNWVSWRPSPYDFFPENITTKHFTHLLYAFATLDSKTFAVIPTSPEVDLGPDPIKQPHEGFYYRFNKRAHAGGVRTLISIGGGGGAALSNRFSNMAKENTSRLAFITSAIKFAREYEFDGLDIDWETPETPQDRSNFASLLIMFRSQITAESRRSKKSALLLTAAVVAWKPHVITAYVVPTLNKYLDWANVMAYDLHGSWDKSTGAHTALEDPAAPALSIKGAVKAWIELGLSPKKLVVGMAAYGRSWTLASQQKRGVGAPATGVGYAGPVVKDMEAGTWAYFEIEKFFVKAGATVVFDKTTSSMYAYKRLQWIGYDNTKTIAIKAKYVKTQGLAGYMFWTLDLDNNYALASAAKLASR